MKKEKVNKKKFKEVFSFQNNPKGKDREIPIYYKKYFDIYCDNGLENVFFFTEKASIFKKILLVAIGIGFVALSVYTGIGHIGFSSFFKAITSLRIIGLGGVLGAATFLNGLDIAFKGENDREFPDSYEVGFYEFLKDRKKIRMLKKFS